MFMESPTECARELTSIKVASAPAMIPKAWPASKVGAPHWRGHGTRILQRKILQWYHRYYRYHKRLSLFPLLCSAFYNCCQVFLTCLPLSPNQVVGSIPWNHLTFTVNQWSLLGCWGYKVLLLSSFGFHQVESALQTTVYLRCNLDLDGSSVSPSPDLADSHNYAYNLRQKEHTWDKLLLG